MAAFELVEVPEVEVLAHELAAIHARASVVLLTHRTRSGDADWHDTSDTGIKPDQYDQGFREKVQVALRYLELRGDALPFRLVRSRAFPCLVKFEER